MKWVVLLFICGFVLPSVVFADDCFQSTTGTDTGICDVGSPCLTFNYTLNLDAPRCDRIFVEAGTYNGVLNRGFNNFDFLPREIIGDSPGSVIIDLENQDRFVLESRTATEIGSTTGESGNFTLRLQNLNFINGLGGWAGGAVAIVVRGTSDGLLAAEAGVIQDCQFTNNQAFAFNAVAITQSIIGGGAVVLNALDYNITSSTFDGNLVNCTNPSTTTFSYNCGGGALRANRDSTAPNNFVIIDSLFQDNSVLHEVDEGISVGGAISTGVQTTAASNDHYNQIEIVRTRFFNNSVSRLLHAGTSGDEVRGGAISLVSSNLFINCSSTGNPEDCALGFNQVTGPQGNTANQYGGGAIANQFATIVAPFSKFITLDTVSLYGNYVNKTDAIVGTRDGGGAINTAQLSVSDCYFCNNTVDGDSIEGEHIFFDPGAGVTNQLVVGPERVVFQCPSNNATAIAPSAFVCNDPLCEYPEPQVDPDTGICTSCLAPFLTPVRISSSLPFVWCWIFFVLSLFCLLFAGLFEKGEPVAE